jgi:hypothetical protein
VEDAPVRMIEARSEFRARITKAAFALLDGDVVMSSCGGGGLVLIDTPFVNL